VLTVLDGVYKRPGRSDGLASVPTDVYVWYPR